MIKQPASLPSVIAKTQKTVMASNTENPPPEHSETEKEEKEDTRREDTFFTQTEVLLSVETKLELQNKLKR